MAAAAAAAAQAQAAAAAAGSGTNAALSLAVAGSGTHAGGSASGSQLGLGLAGRWSHLVRALRPAPHSYTSLPAYLGAYALFCLLPAMLCSLTLLFTYYSEWRAVLCCAVLQCRTSMLQCRDVTPHVNGNCIGTCCIHHAFDWTASQHVHVMRRVLAAEAPEGTALRHALRLHCYCCRGVDCGCWCDHGPEHLHLKCDHPTLGVPTSQVSVRSSEVFVRAMRADV